jgi:hypothetical protein
MKTMNRRLMVLLAVTFFVPVALASDTEYVSLVRAGDRVTGWVGGDHIQLTINGTSIYGWRGDDPVFLKVSGSSISGYVDEPEDRVELTKQGNTIVGWYEYDKRVELTESGDSITGWIWETRRTGNDYWPREHPELPPPRYPSQ